MKLLDIEKEMTSSIKSALGSGMSDSLGDQDYDPNIYSKYKNEFRASSLPFCSRKYVIDARYPTPVLRSESYSFRFYVGIGTAIHETLQQFLGMANILYGHWICCGVIEKDQLGSRLCPVCGRPQKYEEYEIESELGAHVDGVTLKYQAVTEFKSTGADNLHRLASPYPAHMTQASAYLEALNEQYGWSLDKLIFVYVSRDRPTDFRVFVVRPIKGTYRDSLKLYDEAKNSLKNGEIPSPICSSSSDGSWNGCPYAGVCFSPDLEETLIPVEQLSSGVK